MGRLFTRSGLDGFKAELWQMNAGKKIFSFAKHDGRKRQMHLVYLARRQVLTNCRYAAADPHILGLAASLACSNADSGPSVTK